MKLQYTLHYALIVMFLVASLCMPQASGGEHAATEQVCQLISANPPDFHPFQFIPEVADFTQLNRFPKVTYVINEDGNVSNVKIVKGTGSPNVDADLVKSIQAWKYKPQPGCKFESSMTVVIEIGGR